MADNNKTATLDRRNAHSPDLWVPYVMIGASCVTFLAVHFWCYHKRNRERYLRQMDEKRVKFVLMEKRRIATLIQANNQSELDTSANKQGGDLRLSQIHFENSVNPAEESADRKHNPNLPANTGDTQVDIPASATTTDSVSGFSPSCRDLVSNSVSSSQTWPLAAELDTTAYNAHVISSRDTGPTGAEGDVGISGAESKKSYKHISSTHSKNWSNKNGSQITSGDRFVPIETKFMAGIKGNNPNKSEPELSLPTSSHSNVFYTDVSSSPSTKFSLIPSFKLKHSKRRYDGSPVADLCTVNDITSNKWGYSKTRVHQHESSRPNKTYGSCADNHSFVENNSDLNLRSCTRVMFLTPGIREKERLFSNDIKFMQDNIGLNQSYIEKQWVPRNELSQTKNFEMARFCLDREGYSQVGPGVGDRKPHTTSHQGHTFGEDSGTYSDNEKQVPGIPLPSNKQNLMFRYKKNTLGLEKSRSQVMSMTPGHMKESVHRFGSHDNCISTSHLVSGTSMDDLSVPRNHSVETENHHKFPFFSGVQIPDQEKIRTIPRRISLQTDRGNNQRIEPDLSETDDGTEDGIDVNGRVGKITPQLRVLDPSLVFPSTHPNTHGKL